MIPNLGGATGSGYSGSTMTVLRNQCPNLNTVHLAKFMAFCMRQGQEATGVAYGCGTPSGCPDYGLHQSWRNNQNVSSVCYWASAGEDGNGQYSSARSSGAGGYLLRHRLGALHAIVLSGGIALSVGRSAVAARSIGWRSGCRQIGHLSGPHTAGLGASAAVAR